MDEQFLRLRITSDGTSFGSVVRDADTGRILPNVRMASWRCGPDLPSFAIVTLELEGEVDVDLVGVASTKEDENDG
jgi:hypothetical protein